MSSPFKLEICMAMGTPQKMPSTNSLGNDLYNIYITPESLTYACLKDAKVDIVVPKLSSLARSHSLRQHDQESTETPIA